MGMDLTVYTGFYFSIKDTDFEKQLRLIVVQMNLAKNIKKKIVKAFVLNVVQK